LVVTENALVCLGYVAFLHSQDPAHLAKLLNSLPLTGEDEAKEMHGLLFKQMIKGNFCNCKDACVNAVLRIQDASQNNNDIVDEADKDLMAQASKL